ncbi:MAG: putative DNA-binding domain-containing protein [Gammaproteobacteria bacterium]|jgi:hypothetical protein
MAEQPDFIRRQYEFTAHVRDPERNPAPADVEDRRMAIYRELFFNNISGLLAQTFPVLHRLLDDAHWTALVRDFFARHESHTPLFVEVPQEFLAFLRTERGQHEADPPWLPELAHYEWVELALQTSTEELDNGTADRDGDPMAGIPALSPLAWPLAYTWPVHRIGPDFLPQEPGETPTFLVVYRDRHDDVGFMEINAVTARLLELIGDNDSSTGHELLNRIATEMQHPNPAIVIQGGERILADLVRRDILLGTRREDSPGH